MKNLKMYLVLIIIAFLVGWVIYDKVTEPEEIKRDIKIEYERIRDSIKETMIYPDPEVIYIDTTADKIIYLKPDEIIKIKDSIIYVDSSGVGQPAIKANQFDAVLKSNNATADLQILTTGTLLNVTGIIEYEKEIKTIETTKTIIKNGGFIYLETSVFPAIQRYEVGIDYTIRNKFILGSSVSYDSNSSQGYVNFKFGYRIF